MNSSDKHETLPPLGPIIEPPESEKKLREFILDVKQAINPHTKRENVPTSLHEQTKVLEIAIERIELALSKSQIQQAHNLTLNLYSFIQLLLRLSAITKATMTFSSEEKLAVPGIHSNPDATILRIKLNQISQSHSDLDDYLLQEEEFFPTRPKAITYTVPEVPKNRFTSLEQLDKGCQGTVFKAHYGEQIIALKAPFRLERDSATIEAETLKQLYHPNVLQVLALVDTPEDYMIAMPFYQRGNLHEHLVSQQTRFSTLTINGMALDLAKGLQFVHQNNFIHTDIKSANLLVTDDWHLVIADFGLAISTDRGKHCTNGTPLWSSPEALDDKGRTPKDDVFGMGLVFCQFFSLQNPYQDKPFTKNFFMFINAVIDGERPDVAENTPQHFKALIARCWKQRSERATSSEVVAVLEERASNAQTAPK